MAADGHGYAHPEVIVETGWLANHLGEPDLRVLEVNYNPEANYALGHVPGAVLVDFRKDLYDPLYRDILSAEDLTNLLRRAGVGPETTLVLYGDFNNWVATFCFWVFTYYRVRKLRLLNGGRKKWIEEDLPFTKDVPHPVVGKSFAHASDAKLRVFLEDVKAALPRVKEGKIVVLDVRGPKEFSGELTGSPDFPAEEAQRGGHVPGAKNIPWAQAVREDGTFKSKAELEELFRSKGVIPDHAVITYCRIGGRSSHTWFVLRYFLGYPDVRNYSILGLNSWPAINWYQFQIDGSNSNAFNTANGPPIEPVAAACAPNPYPPTSLPLNSLYVGGIRQGQELTVVGSGINVPLAGGVFNVSLKIPAYTSIVLWITEYSPAVPATQVWRPNAPTTLDTTPYGTNVVLRWQPDMDPVFYTHQVFRDGGAAPITPNPLRAALWVDTSPPSGAHSYTIRTVSASGIHSLPSSSITVIVP